MRGLRSRAKTLATAQEKSRNLMTDAFVYDRDKNVGMLIFPPRIPDKGLGHAAFDIGRDAAR